MTRDELRDKVANVIAEHLGDTYDCTRVWEAWSVGTMTEHDFKPIWENDERIAEITQAVISAIEACGVSLVPNEPTAVMVNDGVAAYEAETGNMGEAYQFAQLKSGYAAMLSASPFAKGE